MLASIASMLKHTQSMLNCTFASSEEHACIHKHAKTHSKHAKLYISKLKHANLLKRVPYHLMRFIFFPCFSL